MDDPLAELHDFHSDETQVHSISISWSKYVGIHFKHEVVLSFEATNHRMPKHFPYGNS